MARPFDITTKHLIEHYPADWARAVGAPAMRPSSALTRIYLSREVAGRPAKSHV